MVGRVEVWGGTTEHGRACYHVSVGNKALLLDCGINIATEEMPEIDYDKLDAVDYILLSHSHEDHSKGLIELLKRGYHKKVIMTQETGRQLYEMYPRELKQYAHCFEYIDKRADYLKWFKLSDDIELCYGASGHMYGAIWFLIKIYNKTIFYSGDYSKKVQIVPFHLPENSPNLNVIDFAIIDCANGMQDMNSRLNVSQFDNRNLFLANRFSKIMEIVIRLREQYPNKVFYYDEAFYYEIVRQVKSVNALKYFEDERLNRYSKKFRTEWFEEADFIFLDQDLLNEEKQFVVAFFLQKNGNQMWLTSKANYMKYQSDFENSISDRIMFCNIEAHQGMEGVIELLNTLKMNKLVLCHLEGDKNMEIVNKLQSEGFRNVDICQVKASITF